MHADGKNPSAQPKSVGPTEHSTPSEDGDSPGLVVCALVIPISCDAV